VACLRKLLSLFDNINIAFGLGLEEGKEGGKMLINSSFPCLRKKIGKKKGNLLPHINLHNPIFIRPNLRVNGGEWKKGKVG